MEGEGGAGEGEGGRGRLNNGTQKYPGPNPLNL